MSVSSRGDIAGNVSPVSVLPQGHRSTLRNGGGTVTDAPSPLLLWGGVTAAPGVALSDWQSGDQLGSSHCVWPNSHTPPCHSPAALQGPERQRKTISSAGILRFSLRSFLIVCHFITLGWRKDLPVREKQTIFTESVDCLPAPKSPGDSR